MEVVNKIVFPIVLLTALGFSGIPASASVQNTLVYQGTVYSTADSLPVPTGHYPMYFEFFDNVVGGTSLWGPEEHPAVTVLHGVFREELGISVPMADSLFDGRSLWVETTFNGDPLAVRQHICPVAYALTAKNAFHATYADSADYADEVLPDILSGLDGVRNDEAEIDLVAGSNIGITPDDANNEITIYWKGPDWEHEEPVTAGNCETWDHDLGGDRAKYMVIMDGRESGQPYHQVNYGTNPVRFVSPARWIGAEWSQLTTSTIRVCRGNFDNDASVSEQWDRIRVRIWKNQNE
ncbi:MAG: hypothetical protein KAY24_17650 [Candidatus Eisenbacteria sp.]|nr:hypothetical protein [Candidatus Eisenbacteria bacterium]